MLQIENITHVCRNAKAVFCKFLSYNDTGVTNSHQSGIYIPKNAFSILFNTPGTKGANKDRMVTIQWQQDFETTSRFIYYGSGSRDEYRITRFGRGFPFLSEEYSGDLFILAKMEEEYYNAFVISSDEEIENFFVSFNISAGDTNRLLDVKGDTQANPDFEQLVADYIDNLEEQFPSTQQLSQFARDLFRRIFGTKVSSPDSLIMEWLKIEYNLFKAIEFDRYHSRILTPFNTVDEFIDCANTMLNRRKSRAGKSLEHHLYEVFVMNNIPFGYQIVTEGRKRPDFIFPGQEAYENKKYIEDKLVFLAAKTTCKDRWRQILNEADRIRIKHLFTLQQGISGHQLEEMYGNNVILVVPEQNLNTYPKNYRDKICTLGKFIKFTKDKCY